MAKYYRGGRSSILMDDGKKWIFSYYHLDFIDYSQIAAIDDTEWREVPVQEVRAIFEENRQDAIKNHENAVARKYEAVIRKMA